MGMFDEFDTKLKLDNQGGGVAELLTPLPDAKPDGAPSAPAEPRKWAEPTDLAGQFSEIGEMAKNVPGSAWKTVKGIGGAIYNARETGENIVNLGKGTLQLIRDELGTESLGHEYEQYPEAFGHYLKERYGSSDAIKQTMMDDPVGFLLDASTAFSGAGAVARGGETLATAANAAKTADVLGHVGDVVSQAGKVTSPLKAAGEATKAAASPVGKLASASLGLSTGTEGEAIRIPFQAGKAGGASGEAFKSQFLERAPKREVYDDAVSAVKQLKKDKSAEFKKGFANVQSGNEQLEFTDIDKAMAGVADMVSYHGIGRERLLPIARDLNKQIAQWKGLAKAKPDLFATPEGFHQLKERIWDIAKNTKDGTPESKMAMDVYHGVRNTIIKQSPKYAKVMKGYEEASDIIKQLESTLSANPNASIDTALRKLQSVLRNNVNTSYGHRRDLAEFLVNAGAPHLLEKIAGQALTPTFPRGLGRAALGAEGVLATALGGFHALPAMIPAALLSSPKAVGAASYGLGAASRYGSHIPLDTIGKGAYQAGHLDEAQTDSITDLIEKALH